MDDLFLCNWFRICTASITIRSECCLHHVPTSLITTARTPSTTTDWNGSGSSMKSSQITMTFSMIKNSAVNIRLTRNCEHWFSGHEVAVLLNVVWSVCEIKRFWHKACYFKTEEAISWKQTSIVPFSAWKQNNYFPGIVKIKTIGSTYMCASGLNTSLETLEVKIRRMI